MGAIPRRDGHCVNVKQQFQHFNLSSRTMTLSTTIDASKFSIPGLAAIRNGARLLRMI